MGFLKRWFSWMALALAATVGICGIYEIVRWVDATFGKWGDYALLFLSCTAFMAAMTSTVSSSNDDDGTGMIY